MTGADERAPAPEPVAGRTAIGTVGRWLLVAAGLVLAFVAYQQWGTGLAHWQGQRSLRTRFAHEIASPTGVHHGSGGRQVPYPSVGAPVGVIQIPRIGLDQVVVEGVEAAQLAVGPGHYPGTALPGQAGNAGIAGHRTTHGAPFYGLDQVRTGDPIVVTTLQGRFTYRVVRSLVVSPDDGAVLAPSSSPELTLTTCNPKYSAAQRLVVVADLESPPAPTTAPPARATYTVLDDRPPGAATWVNLGLAVAGLVTLVVALGVVRRRRTLIRWARWAPWVAAPVAVLLVLVAFGALDALLPQGF